MATLNLFQALQPEQQLSNSKRGHGEKRTSTFVIFGTELRNEKKKKVKRRFWLGLTQALGMGMPKGRCGPPDSGSRK